MYARIPEIWRRFFEGACTPRHTTANSHDPPPHNSRIDSCQRHWQQEWTGQVVGRLPRPLDQVYRLGDKLVDVVVVAVVNAVDLA